MTKNKLFTSKYRLIIVLILCLTFFNTFKVNAQCAGNDNLVPLVICDISIPANQSVNLFTLLGGTPTAGGSWSDDLSSGGLNTATGILNVLQINISGTYTYTYTVQGVAGCVDNSSTVSVNIGSYPGVKQNGPVCADETFYNLFGLFNYEAGNIAPHTNGVWFNVTTNSPVSGFSINPSSLNVLVQTDFVFSYTLPAVAPCTAPAVVLVTLTVFPPPKVGTPIPLNLCSNTNLSLYANVNLFSLLNGEDLGGVWDEISGTNEIAGNDTTINIQNIYNTLGAGSYKFTYKITPLPPICDPKTATVTIVIEDPVDYSNINLLVNSNICENQIPTATYSATLTQNPVVMPNGTYTVSYTISGSPFTATVTFTNGIASFSMPSASFQSVGTFPVVITNIVKSTSLGICINPVSILPKAITIAPLPNINNVNVSILPICQNENAIVQLTNLSSLVDGNYTITYNLSGSNTANAQTAVISVVAGVASFTIQSSVIPLAGNTSVTITNIVNNTSTCSNIITLAPIPFEIKPLPVVSNLSITVNGICAGQPLVVRVSGLGTITSANIDYTLSGLNVSTNQNITFPVSAGIGSFIIPQSLVPNTGITTIKITDLVNIGNSCGVVLNNDTRNFTINPIPTAPTASNLSFCKTDNATVASLLPNGSQYQWFNSSTSTTVLSPSATLLSGNYFVQEVNTITGCQSTRTSIAITINELNTPTIISNGEQFCGLDKPTLQELSANTTTSNTLVWYDAASGGNLLPNTTLLTEGTTYYGFDFSATLNCSSTNSLAVTVSLTKCNTVNPEVVYDFYIPDGFSPNNDGVNDFFTIPKIEFIYPNYTLEIYNRYGNIIFTGDKNKPKWDGKSTANANVLDGIAPNGVYFYIVNFNKDNKVPKQGRLYLNR